MAAYFFPSFKLMALDLSEALALLFVTEFFKTVIDDCKYAFGLETNKS
jgi:hypothetical protein